MELPFTAETVETEAWPALEVHPAAVNAQTATRPVETVSTSSSGSPWAMILTVLASDLLSLTLISAAAAYISTFFLGAAAAATQTVVLANVLAVGGYAFHGLYRSVHQHPAEEFRLMSVVTLVVFLGTSVTAAVLGYEGPATVLMGTGLAAAVLVPAARTIARILAAQTSWWGVPTTVIGTTRQVGSVAEMLDRWPELGLCPVKLLHDQGQSEEGLSAETVKRMCALAGPDRTTSAIVFLPESSYKDRSRLLAHVSKFFDRLIVVPGGQGLHTLWTTRNFSSSVSGQSSSGGRHRARTFSTPTRHPLGPMSRDRSARDRKIPVRL